MPLLQENELIPLKTWLGFCSEGVNELVKDTQELLRSSLAKVSLGFGQQFTPQVWIGVVFFFFKVDDFCLNQALR